MTKSILAACCTILFLAGCSTVSEAGATHKARSESGRIEANKALARRWFDEVINQRNLEVMTDTYAVDYVHHGPEGIEPDAEPPPATADPESSAKLNL